jgi:hypothetical protein
MAPATRFRRRGAGAVVPAIGRGSSVRTGKEPVLKTTKQIELEQRREALRIEREKRLMLQWERREREILLVAFLFSAALAVVGGLIQHPGLVAGGTAATVVSGTRLEYARRTRKRDLHNPGP